MENQFLNTLISVIIPVYNRELELKRAIDSALNQTLKNVEILVVDDASTIDIASIVDSYKNESVRYFRVEKKSNANVCRNIGLNNAKGEFVAMLDSDDEWLPNHLKDSLDFLEKYNVDGVFSCYLVDDGANKRKRFIRPIRDKEKMVNYILDGNTAATPTHFYKTKCAKDILWDEELQRHQDYDFSIRFANKYKFIPFFSFNVVVHWKKNEKRNEHLESQIRFIEKHKNDILPKFYMKYHRDVCSNILKRIDVSKSIKNHFKKEFLRYFIFISLVDYLSALSINSNKIERFVLRLKFVFRVLFI